MFLLTHRALEVQQERIIKLESDTRIPDLQAIAQDYEKFKGEVCEEWTKEPGCWLKRCVYVCVCVKQEEEVKSDICVLGIIPAALVLNCLTNTEQPF